MFRIHIGIARKFETTGTKAMKIGAVINKAAGTHSPEKRENLVGEVKRYLEPRISPGCLAVTAADRVEEKIKSLVERDIEVLVVGGGDGTVSTAAGMVSETDIALAVIGLGTKNNFARDLGIPEEPEEAIRLLDRMDLRQIDMGEVNGHRFVNNATIGLYPRIVEEREKAMQKNGWKKWAAHTSATFKVLWWLPQMRLIVRNESRNTSRFIPFLFVGNNEYEGKMIGEFRRATLDGGKLWFCMPQASGIRPLLRMALQLNFRGFRGVENLETELVDSLTVYSLKRSLKVAIDGENHKLTTPLRFSIHKKVLRVVVP